MWAPKAKTGYWANNGVSVNINVSRDRVQMTYSKLSVAIEVLPFGHDSVSATSGDTHKRVFIQQGNPVFG